MKNEIIKGDVFMTTGARKNVIVATGLPKMNDSVFGNRDVNKLFNVVDFVDNRNNIVKTVKENPNTDIVLVSDGLTGEGESLSQIMIDVHLNYPGIRVIYLTSEVKRSQAQARMTQLGYLVRTHIYDIIAESPLTMKSIVQSLIKPATKDNVDWILRFINQEEEISAPKEEVEVLVDEETKRKGRKRGVVDNLFVFSSIKPGTGKSFIATNIAVAIAKYGTMKKNGERPKVALIDGDMQNLSIGTLLQVEDEKYNLRTVMDKIHSVHDEQGNEIDNPRLISKAKNFIKDSFIPYTHSDNLHVLAGSQLQWDKVQDFTDSDFTYLLQSIKNEYDVIIMDSSSNLAHVSTAPMLVMASRLYYILNLDFNNIRNNSRYNGTLAEFGVQDKVKYILNESITKDSIKEQEWSEDLIFNEEAIKQNGFDLVGSIPIIEKTTFLNRIFMGEPVAMDDQTHTLDARIAISEIANQIWDIENLPYLKEKKEKLEASKNGKRKGLFGLGRG